MKTPVPIPPEPETSAEPQIVLRPQPGPQTEFFKTRADIAIYGGAAGGGKTWALEAEPLRYIETVPGFGGVMFRRTSVQVLNKGGMWDESFTIYPLLRAESNITRLEWTFPPYGNKIRFGHMEHEKTRFDWQGAQIPYIGWDELTHFTEEQFFYMLSRNRSTCGVKPYVRATTNPDADSWVANFISWWIHPETGLPIPERASKLRYFVRLGDQLHWASDPNELAPLTDGLIIPKSVTFIPANVHDNTILLDKDPGYLANLHALTNVERERLLGGNWKIRPASGLVFNRAWFQYVDAKPYDAIARVRYWDKAGTEEGGKYTCGVLMARTMDNRFIVEHVIRGQWASREREQIIKQTARMDGPDVNIYVEQEPGSGGKESAENTIRGLAGYAVYADKVTGDKETRAEPYAAQVQGRNVYILRDEWNKAYIDELDGFPEGRFSDQVDASSGAFNKLAALVIVDDMESEWLPGIPEDEDAPWKCQTCRGERPASDGSPRGSIRKRRDDSRSRSERVTRAPCHQQR